MDNGVERTAQSNTGDQHEERDSQTFVQPTRSLYALTRSEVTKGIANRFVHSRTYIALYLVMAALSVTTVVLSLVDGCPGKAFYALEIIINGSMILEVGVRYVAFGKQFWKSPFNVVDLCLTFLCVVTLLVIVFAGCGSTSREEELLDTLLLVARNVLQFGRLATVMRRSGRSIFTAPKPIDLSSTQRGEYSPLDIDLPGGEDEINPWRDEESESEVVFDVDDLEAAGRNGSPFGYQDAESPDRPLPQGTKVNDR